MTSRRSLVTDSNAIVYNRWHETELERWLSDHGMTLPWLRLPKLIKYQASHIPLLLNAGILRTSSREIGIPRYRSPWGR